MPLILNKNYSLRTRLVLGIGVMLLPLCILVLTQIVSTRNSADAVEETIYSPIEKLQVTTRLQKLLHGAKNPIQGYIDRREQAHRVAFEHLDAEVNLTFDEGGNLPMLVPRERELLALSRSQWETVNKFALRVFDSGEKGGALSSSDVFEFHRALDKELTLLDQMEATIVSSIQNQRLTAQKLQWEGIAISLMIFGGCFLLAIIGAWVLYQSVTAPIRKLERTVNKFGQGDLTSRVSLQSNDELGHLATAFNAMAERFQKVQSELDYLAVHDALTSLYDRTKLREIVELEILRAKRYERPFSLLFIDIDDFRSVNDRYGHLVGDSLLCSVAIQINNSLRPTDNAARYGDDAFAVVLTETPAEGALDVANRIGRVIADNPLNIGDGKTIQITVSIGVATYPYDADSGTALFAHAEQVLDRAKHMNRKTTLRVAHSGSDKGSR